MTELGEKSWDLSLYELHRWSSNLTSEGCNWDKGEDGQDMREKYIILNIFLKW